MFWISPASRWRGHWKPHSGILVGMTVLAWVLKKYVRGMNTSAGEGEEATGKEMSRKAITDPLAQDWELH